jgi:tetraacyldisaccharide 4'-kinase
MHDWLVKRWYSPRAPLLLRPLSALFRLAVGLRRWAYRLGIFSSGHPGVPVIVVGNITVGGTGKTPLTLWLASQLKLKGLTVGILTRGYGGRLAGPLIVKPDSAPADVGDETLLLAQRSGQPVALARQRLEGARLLAAQGCQVILADDGLQHLALKRDLEIMVVDTARGFGNGSLLPAGPLRESRRRAKRVGLVVINGPGEVARLVVGNTPVARMQLQPMPLRSLLNGQTQRLVDLKDKTVHAVAGIGDPERFFRQLREEGLTLIEHAFADHHAFVAADFAFGDEHPVLMTEKDAVKCQDFADARMWFMPVSVQMSGADAEQILNLALHCVFGKVATYA